jgi:hypothetical protein
MTSVNWLATHDVTSIRLAATMGVRRSPKQCHRVVTSHQFDHRV